MIRLGVIFVVRSGWIYFFIVRGGYLFSYMDWLIGLDGELLLIWLWMLLCMFWMYDRIWSLVWVMVFVFKFEECMVFFWGVLEECSSLRVWVFV